MSTSDLLTRMYAMPSEVLNRQQQTLMQKLHTTLGSPTSATTAPSGHCFNGSAPISTCSSDPYLHRVYWLLRNSKGHYLAALCGTVLQWESSANAVPAEYRFCTHQRVKSYWLQIRELTALEDVGLAISPVDFYAHRHTPYLWCALDD
ncbi:MAG: hypothetical protein ACO242_06330 [Candidatus Fonsibacter ubiquis]